MKRIPYWRRYDAALPLRLAGYAVAIGLVLQAVLK